MAMDIRDLARQFYAEIDATKMQVLPSVASPDVTVTQPGMPPMDWDGIRQFGGLFYAAFPNLRHDVEQQYVDGDVVVNVLTARGTHLGEFQGMPATGKEVGIAAITIQRWTNGRLSHQHLLMDALGMMQQLGAIPSPEQVPA